MESRSTREARRNERRHVRRRIEVIEVGRNGVRRMRLEQRQDYAERPLTLATLEYPERELNRTVIGRPASVAPRGQQHGRGVLWPINGGKLCSRASRVFPFSQAAGERLGRERVILSEHEHVIARLAK